MKKMLLSLAITAALAGCGGGETLEDVKNDTPPVIPSATVKFDPANGVISVPNDLLMSGTKDGTLNIPGELDDENASITRDKYADPQLALGALDGWSTQTPFKIDLTFPPGVSLDETSAASPGTVRIFEVIMGASLTDAECSQAPAGAACKLVGELTFGVDFVTQASGDAVAIVPLKPFKAGSSYINVLTTGLKDSEGRAISPSSTYTTVKQEAPLVTPAQLALQGAVNSYENVVVSSGNITKDDIIYSAAMTMQSAGPVLGTIKKVLAASLTEPTIQTPALQIPAQPVKNVQGFFEDLGRAVPDVFQAAQYQRGSIQLPMYLGTPTGKSIDDLNDTYWQGMCDSAVAVMGYKAQAGDAFPTDPISTNDAMCAALSEGQLRDLGLDSTRHLTKYNSLPKVQGMANVPVQITKPILPVVNAYRTGLGLEPFTAMPENGWPVVILQHGITTQKESMLTLTAQLSLQGFATAAIDHPRHGERGIDVDADGTDDFNATTGSVLSYMNLSSLLVARDSLRQSSADLLGLRLGLNFSGDNTLNAKDVSYIGHSLGSIVAPAFIAQANSPLDDQVDPFFKVNAVALASGGGGIASFLLESAAFGPFIQGSVLDKAEIAEADEFKAFREGPAVSNCGESEETQASLSCGFIEFATSLTMAGETDKLENIKGVMTQFVFAAQTALDSGDPTNYAATVKALETPVYMNVVVGDSTENNKEDQVIPPMTANNPIAGTLPLANFMGLETVSTTQDLTEAGASYLVKFNTGHHGSVLTPEQDESQSTTVAGSAAANAEMQFQIAAYLVSRGRLLSVRDTSVVTN